MGDLSENNQIAALRTAYNILSDVLVEEADTLRKDIALLSEQLTKQKSFFEDNLEHQQKIIFTQLNELRKDYLQLHEQLTSSSSFSPDDANITPSASPSTILSIDTLGTHPVILALQASVQSANHRITEAENRASKAEALAESLALANKKSSDEITLLRQQLESFMIKTTENLSSMNVKPTVISDTSPSSSTIVPPSLPSQNTNSSSIIVPAPLPSTSISTASGSSSTSSSTSPPVTVQQYNTLIDKVNTVSDALHQLSTTTTEANTVLANDLHELNKYLQSIQIELHTSQQSNRMHTDNLHSMILNQEKDTIQRIGKAETQLQQYIQDKLDTLRTLYQQYDQTYQTILGQQKIEYTKFFSTLENTTKHHKTRLDALAAAVHAFAGVLSIGKNLFGGGGTLPNTNTAGTNNGL